MKVDDTVNWSAAGTPLPPEVMEFFRKQGAKGGKIGGKIGGKRSLETMTPEERSARAKKASAAVAASEKELKHEAQCQARTESFVHRFHVPLLLPFR